MQRGIQTYGLVLVPKYGYIYAYEVDGFGHAILTDDANIPSLLAAPYFGYTAPGDRYYENTRRFLLSQDNPSFYQGHIARGIGSYHTPDHWVWPLALIMRGAHVDLQLREAGRARAAARQRSRAITCCTSRSIRIIRSSTRAADFGWPNALFSEFVMTQFEGAAEIPMGDTSDLEFNTE